MCIFIASIFIISIHARFFIMRNFIMNAALEKELIDRIIAQALDEDLNGRGDITSQALFDDASTATAVIKSKQRGILSGAYLLTPLFSHLDSSLDVAILLADGSRLETGSEICRLEGRVRSILAGERTALNFLQRLSGIATSTARLVSLLQGTSARLLDTRKTTPLLRLFEKKAVVAGGGCNHRFGLFDMMLIKDTHVKAAGSVAAAVRKAKHARSSIDGIKIEVEVQNVDQFYEAVAETPDRIMLDNMLCEHIKQCVAHLREKDLHIETEASGNVTEDTIADIAATGVDFISSGAITHSAAALDIHLVIL
jgi:nicotinate-nucleotide pyrophosphorylase (carboxylating)